MPNIKAGPIRHTVSLVTAMRSAGVILLGLTGAWGHGKQSDIELYSFEAIVYRQHVLTQPLVGHL